jgi:two-component system chemotaxis sensor kinase CheA
VSSEELRKHIEEIRRMAVEESLKDAIIARIKKEILRRLSSLREVPARRGLARSLKIVPGLIQRLGKDVAFELSGENTPIDCDIARELNTALIHMIRNALDHGIEDLEARMDAGKPEQGQVRIAVERDTGRLTVTLTDDGKGLDPEALKAAAVRKGILTPEEAQALDKDAALQLIFRPGFSMAVEITDVSGRGVGMDAVRQSVYVTLGGTMHIESEKGRGTRFVIEVPLAA